MTTNTKPDQPECAGDDLKPCPFCGGAASVYIGEHSFMDAIVRCEWCSTEGPVFDEWELPTDNRAEAMLHWNTRTPPTGEK